MSNTKTDKLLEKFDKAIENILNNFLPKVSRDFTNSNNQILITLNENLDNIQKKVTSLSTNAGLYLFEINLQDFYNKQIDSFGNSTPNKVKVTKQMKNEIYKNLKDLWSSNSSRTNSNHPKLIKKRFEFHLKLKPYKNNFETQEWIPLYLGISHNLQGRILEHIDCDSDTFSMKLSHLSNTGFKDFPIRISTSEIPNITLNRRYMIVKEIESTLREQLHPLVGRQ